MVASARHILRLAGLAVVLVGLATMTGNGIAAANDAEAGTQQVRDMEHLVESAQYAGEYQEQMFDLLADMKSPIAAMPTPEHPIARGES